MQAEILENLKRVVLEYDTKGAASWANPRTLPEQGAYQEVVEEGAVYTKGG